MPKPLNPKCQLCAKLPTAKAKVLHGTQGDGCWNPKICHNRRSFYRSRTEDNSGIDSIAVEPPATYFAVLYLYKEPGDKPLHSLGAELWLGQQPICRLEAIHCFGLTAGKMGKSWRSCHQVQTKQFSLKTKRNHRGLSFFKAICWDMINQRQLWGDRPEVFDALA